jgi:hypothetical protein
MVLTFSIHHLHSGLGYIPEGKKGNNMCFSATASFSASAVLVVCGVVALKSSHQSKQWTLAAVPIIFAAQQFIEGFLWMGLKNQNALLSEVCMYVFLTVAQVLWPFWMALSFIKLEENAFRKKILWISFYAGCGASCMLVYRLVFFNINAQIRDHHIYYDITSPQWMITASSILYVIATLLPSFASTLHRSKVLGFMLLASLLVSKIFFNDYLISVWCFFAAIISILIIFMIKGCKMPIVNRTLL